MILDFVFLFGAHRFQEIGIYFFESTLLPTMVCLFKSHPPNLLQHPVRLIRTSLMLLIKPDSLFALYTNVRKILYVIELDGAQSLIVLDEHSLSEYYFSDIE
jgi:hypothetical protein